MVKKKKEKRKKKNPIKEMIDARGLKPRALVLAGVIWERISNAEVAYQFVLEELGAAHNGNDAAQAFAKQSGIAFKSYEGAMQRIWSAIDGPDGPQQRLLQTCAMLKAYPDLIVALRIAIVDATMSRYELGKYDTTLNQKDKENDFAVNDPFEVESSGQATEVLAQVIERQANLGIEVFADILSDLSNYKKHNPVMSPPLTMAHTYAVRFVLAGGFLQRTIDGNSIKNS